MAERPERRRGPLSPIEIATAAVMAALATVLSVIGWLLPHATVVQSLGAVPFGVVAHRHRPRALAASTVAAVVVSFLAAGTGPAVSVVNVAVVGGLVGDVKRRGRGLPTVVAGAAVAAPFLAACTDGLLLAFSQSRQLALEQIRNVAHGAARAIAGVPGAGGVAHTIDGGVGAAVSWWWLTVGAVVVVSFAIGLVAGWVVLGGVLERMAWMGGDDRLGGVGGGADALVGPLPLRLDGVHHRYPGASSDALVDIGLEVRGPEVVALVGVNGSGKSTLARILAGATPSGGRVERPGVAGLGRRGGTAVVSQRPETQVLGVRVADDVVWGMPAGSDVDVEGLLAEVGLGGMGRRETATLSGGELQRLALAAALARRPALLLSDESTAMVDPSGRAEILDVLRRLPAAHGTTVVHVTHHGEEARAADRVVQLADGRIVDGGLDELLAPPSGAPARPGPGTRAGTALLAVRGVVHTYAAGSPWAQPALRGVDLDVHAGEGVLVVGGNGSGKSTLAWVLAGLLRPEGGSCTIGGVPVADRVGSVALAFQHARLQLWRPTVAEEIRSATRAAEAQPGDVPGWFPDPRSRAGWQRRWSGSEWTADVRPAADTDRVFAALATVGLDPSLAGRRLDQLSGGQLRRVALAALLARDPDVLVLDEPLAGLDPPSRRSLLDLLARLRAAGTTLVVISHDLGGMGAVCDRTVELDRGRVVVPSPAGAGRAGGRAVAR